jgi:L-alanine-DL-glutamate epimerase-like enolase superfamily enzyme
VNLEYREENWPVAGVFRISRGAVTSVDVLVTEIHDGELVGRGEGCPEGHFGEGMQNSFRQLDELNTRLEEGLSRSDLQDLLPAGAARNAVDCALWDLEAKRADEPAWRAAGLPGLKEIVTAYTISLDDPDKMEQQAAGASHHPLLKIKLGGGDDVARVAAVRRGAAESRLIVDANEAWGLEDLQRNAGPLADLGVELIEQPLPAAEDSVLDGFTSPVPLCADESCLHRGSLATVAGRYQFINIKLDKTGGLTEALALARDAQERGLRLMVGCMLGTSLAMAPGSLIGQLCEFVDLDGPLLLASDRVPCIRYDQGVLMPPPRELWG